MAAIVIAAAAATATPAPPSHDVVGAGAPCPAPPRPWCNVSLAAADTSPASSDLSALVTSTENGEGSGLRRQVRGGPKYAGVIQGSGHVGNSVLVCQVLVLLTAAM